MTEEMLSALRADMKGHISPYRLGHTLGVEEMAARLGALYCPEKTCMLRAAALLHDMTKELADKEQLAILADHGVTLRPDEQASPKVWHGITAALLIPKRYPRLESAELISAVRWHTTGRQGMTLPDAIIYLADLIEEGRTFPDCISVRKAFWDAEPEKMAVVERRRHLRDVILLSFEKTLSKLQKGGGVVCLDTIAAREDLQNRTRI